MRFCIKYACDVACILLDGTMSSTCFQAGDVIAPVSPVCLPSADCGVVHVDIDAGDMTLINVPLSLIEVEESDNAHCV